MVNLFRIIIQSTRNLFLPFFKQLKCFKEDKKKKKSRIKQVKALFRVNTFFFNLLLTMLLNLFFKITIKHLIWFISGSHLDEAKHSKPQKWEELTMKNSALSIQQMLKSFYNNFCFLWTLTIYSTFNLAKLLIMLSITMAMNLRNTNGESTSYFFNKSFF